VREYQLHVKYGGGDWQLRKVALPGQCWVTSRDAAGLIKKQEAFNYNVDRDGEYWFSVVTVNKDGRSSCPDVNRMPPGLIVIVDTVPPTVDVRRATGPAGENCVRVTVKDANPDSASLQVSYRGADQAWHPLAPLPGSRELFRVPGPEAFTGVVRVSARDLAQNETTREVTLEPPARPVAAAPPAPTAPPRRIADTDLLPLEPPAGPAARSAPTAPPEGNETRTSYQGAPERISSAAPLSRQLLNTVRASIDYRLDQVGPSGVSKVEIWVTTDDGKSWQRLAENTTRRSPAVVDLPGEGLYGIRLVVTNGNGFGGRPPLRGEAPTCWIEVDTTPPHARLHDIDPVTRDGTLEIRWTATDKNLGPEPVSIYYATRREGPWQAIARGVRNDGVYRWAFPRDVGAQFFVRLEVMDQAGNVTRCDSNAPIVLDLSEPRALVVGVSGAAPRGVAPGGN
jgi:hypothetical protein